MAVGLRSRRMKKRMRSPGRIVPSWRYDKNVAARSGFLMAASAERRSERSSGSGDV